MTEFPSNTRPVARAEPAKAPKAEPVKPKVEKIVTGPVVQRKKSLATRFKNNFLGGDAKGAGIHVANEVVVPALRDLLFDAITSAAEGIIYTATGGRVSSNAASRLVNQASNSVVNYNRFGGNAITGNTSIRPDPRATGRPQLSQQARSQHDFREIILATRPEAMQVLERMSGLVQRYDTCSVLDLYNMLGLDTDFTDEAWGWYSLEGAHVHRARGGGGFQLNLPKPEPLA